MNLLSKSFKKWKLQLSTAYDQEKSEETNVLFVFKKWKEKVSFAKYDRWCEENHEYLLEEQKKWLEEKIPYGFNLYYKLV